MIGTTPSRTIGAGRGSYFREKNMELVRNFSNLNQHDTDLAGGKGASLGEMTQSGIPVPPGFVVLSIAFEQFTETENLKSEIDAILHEVNHQEILTLEQASEAIRALIRRASMPQNIADEILKHLKQLDSQYVAVRSSATAEDSASAAWAGQLESYLNVTEDQVIDKVKQCWSSLFTPRAIFYRFEKGLYSHHISVAVVIQKMINSEVSGIAFSVHPVTEDPNQVIIEAGYGLGEAIVSGQITPDSYVVEKVKNEIIYTSISVQERGLYKVNSGGNEWQDITKVKGEKQKLNNKEIRQLAKLVIHIENHYGFPCDIEWALNNGTFFIIQSRPITTLTSKVAKSANE
jgi:pyruvate,water dikinase